MKIGILGIQGSREEHEKMLQKMGVETLWVRNPADLKEIDGLIIPGGESTAIGKALKKQGLYNPLKKRIEEGVPVWGTCAGAILLAEKGSEYSLKVLDAEIQRNAYGRQTDSFITDLEIEKIGKFPAVFIRAPRFGKLEKGVEILASYKNEPVMVRQKNILSTTFHPELTEDARVHEYFVGIVNDML